MEDEAINIALNPDIKKALKKQAINQGTAPDLLVLHALTAPLVAFLNKDDSNHAICVDIAKSLPAAPLLTTWLCFTEAIYLLGEVCGYRYQAEQWKLLSTQKITLHNLKLVEVERMMELMEKYQDTAVALAVASFAATVKSPSFHQFSEG